LKNGSFVISKKANVLTLPIYHNFGEVVDERSLTFDPQKAVSIRIGTLIHPVDKTVDEIRSSNLEEMERLMGEPKSIGP
jgi:hypothetical protein